MTSARRPSSIGSTLRLAAQGLTMWTPRQIKAALVASAVVAVTIGIATVLIPNPLFARDIEPVWWNYPIWLLTSVLSGMLVATYVRPFAADTQARTQPPEEQTRRSSRMGLVGGVLAWFAVGCPVCNKLALVALGYSGAITWFAPVQPFLAGAAVLFCAAALVVRLKGQVLCTVPKPSASADVPEAAR